MLIKLLGMAVSLRLMLNLKTNTFGILSILIYNVIWCCKACQSEKPYKHSTSFHLVKPKFAWHTVSIDVVGPIPKCSSGHIYLIIAIDELTKWVEAKPICNLSANTAANFILDFILCWHGCPQFIKTDNSTNFTTSVIPKLNELMGIEVYYQLLIIQKPIGL